MSSVVTMNDSPSDLVDWLHSVGIWWNDSLVQICGSCSNCSGPALGVFSVKDIQENDLLCVIPRAAILSPRTTQLAQILEAEKLGGGLALTIAVMFEASLGTASKWAGYFASLPVREYLPMFWSDEELQLLTGTALDGVVQEDRQDTAEDYKQHVVPLMVKYPNAFPNPDLCSLRHFRRAASWVASRSFHVDNWHGDAMVPLADIFNHKASLVLLGDSWQVAEESDSQHDHHQQPRQRQQQQQQHQGEHSEAEAPANGLPSDKAGKVQQVDGESAQSAEEGPAGSGPEDQQLDPDPNQGASEGSKDSMEGDESQDGEQSNHSEEQSDHSDRAEEEEDHSEDDADDPQHGFAVGGMPMIAAAAGGATAAGGIVHKSAGCWVRDGINLRLEIGICSMGDPDTALATPTAAAAEANGPFNQHRHDHAPHSDHCGSAHGEGGAEDKHESQGQCQKRVAEESQQEQQKAKKQKTEQQQPKQHQQHHFPDKRLEIVAASPVASGAEVHNTYGELSNHVLVHKYGFCLPANPFDEVQLGQSWQWLLQDVVKAAGLNKQLKHHIKWLQDHSNLLPDDDAEDEEAEDPPAVAPGGRLPLLVAAVLRLLGLPTSKLKTLDSLQELLEQPAQQEQQAADQNQQQKKAKKPKEGSTNQSAADQDATMTTTAGSADAAEMALAQHFQDMQITSRNFAWWGEAGLQVLQEAVQQRLQQYPSKGLSIAEDEQALQQLRSHQQQQQESAAKQEGEQPGIAAGDDLSAGPHNPGEHGAAVRAAVQLRICEQRILKQALDAVQHVLSSNQV